MRVTRPDWSSPKIGEKVGRDVQRAQSYLRNSREWLWYDGAIRSWQWFSYWQLLEQAIDTATFIVAHMPDKYFETDDDYSFSDDLLADAHKLLAAIEARREPGRQLSLIKKLENVTGRSPEEAEAYLRKAAELRKTLDGEPPAA